MKRKTKILLKQLSRLTERTARPFCSAVIVAGGSASRMGGIDKVFADLGGKCVLQRTCEAFAASDMVDEIIVVVRGEEMQRTEALLRQEGLKKLAHIVAGGNSRMQSVRCGLAAISKYARLVAVHDGARPLVSGKVIEDAVSAAKQYGAAAPAVPVKDTIKRVEGDLIAETPQRSTLRAVQTPQVFAPELLLAGFQQAEKDGAALTDDCSAVELLGIPVHLTEGNYRNLKITTPEDLVLARALWKGET